MMGHRIRSVDVTCSAIVLRAVRWIMSAQVDELDYAIRIKSLEKATDALTAAQSALDTAIAAV